jgi:hypothetical protein
MTPNDRLDAFLHELDRTKLADLEVLALPEPDPDGRAALLARVAEAAAQPDAVDVEGTRIGVRELMLRRLSGDGFRPTWAGLNWVASPMRIEDRARLIVAVEDAAVAALLEDRLDPDDVAALGEPYAIASSMEGAGTTGVPDLSGSRIAAAPLTALAVSTGAGGLGIIATIAAFLRRRRRRLEQDD